MAELRGGNLRELYVPFQKVKGDMDTNPEFEKRNRGKTAEIVQNLESAHKEDLEAVLQVLVKITSRTREEIKPHLDAMLERLVEPQERPFYETATAEEWIRAFRAWADSHDRNTPLLSDYAVSRESM